MSDNVATLPSADTASQQITRSPNAPYDQYGRKINLTVYSDKTGNGLDLSQMRIKFQVRRTTLATANELTARVYNLRPDTQNNAIREFNRVTLAAGYKLGRFGTLFDGTIVQYKRGKETPVDSYLEIVAGDGDKMLNYGTIAKTLAAGATIDDRGKAIAQGFVDQGGEVGKLDFGKSGSRKSIRGVTLFGMSRELMRDLSNSAKSDWSIQDGKVVAISREGYLAGEQAVLTPKTGLVGMPEVTEAGISIRCLLNSALRLGGLVKIDTGLLSGVPYTPGGENSISGLSSGGTSPTQTTSTSGDNNPLRNTILNSAATSPQGVYKILLLTHSGDTRENPWYSDMVCIAFDETTGKILSIPNDATFRGFQDENSAAQGSARPGQ